MKKQYQNKSYGQYVNYVFRELYEEEKYVSETCWDKHSSSMMMMMIGALGRHNCIGYLAPSTLIINKVVKIST